MASDRGSLLASWEGPGEQPLPYYILSLLQEVGTLIDNNETPESPNPDLAELKVTLQQVRSSVSPFLLVSSQGPDVALDICLQDVRRALHDAHSEMVALDRLLFSIGPSADRATAAQISLLDQHKVDLYRADFSLRISLDQLTGLFPTGAQPLIETLVKDRQGSTFWRASFSSKLLIPWERFFRVFQSFLSADLRPHEQELRYFIDFLHDGFVSAFEFGRFLEWFGPLAGSPDRVLAPLKAGVLAGFIPAIEAHSLLSSQPPGTYLIRFSKTRAGCFALTYLNARSEVKHCLLHTNKGKIVLDNPPDVFDDLAAFTASYQGRLKHPLRYFDGERVIQARKAIIDATPPPSSSSSSPSSPHSQGSSSAQDPSDQQPPPPKEEKIGDCVICLDQPIGTVFLECGHLACCRTCASSPQLKNCPICRAPILRILPIFPV